MAGNLYAQRWKDTLIPTMKKCMVKMIWLMVIEKLTVLIKEKNLTSFVSMWKPLLHLELKVGGKLNVNFRF